MQFTGDGGGDTPESVNQALYEALSRTRWSDDPAAYRVVFLVGDAPPQMNYQNDVPYGQSCRQANRRGIIVNTIQCGDLPETAPSFQAIARLGEGQYFRVAQSGSAMLYDTPFDQKIGDLSRALDNTRIFYGEAGQIERMEARKKTAAEIYTAAAPSAVAKRTIFNSKKAGAKNFLGSQELVDDVASGRMELEKIEQEKLPAELKGLSQGQKKDLVAARIEQRQALRAEIDRLAKQRQAYIEEKVRQKAGEGAQSLDARICQCIQTQAARKDIRYSGGPAY